MVRMSNKMDRYFAIVALLCCASQVLCQQVANLAPGGSTRIVGGVPASIETYPYIVQVNELNSTVCGGTLVSPRCVLTAASCVAGPKNPKPDPKNISVRVGTSTLNVGGTHHAVAKVEVHPNYNTTTWESDLAILVLTHNVTLSQQVSPLTVAATDAPDNTTVSILGWGRLQVGQNQTNQTSQSAVLNKADVVTVNRTLCAQLYSPLQVSVTENSFCAGMLHLGGTTAACDGDKGGPVMLNNALVGVISRDRFCGQVPGVHVRLSQYNNWIQSTVKKHNSGHTLAGLSAAMLILSLFASLNIHS